MAPFNFDSDLPGNVADNMFGNAGAVDQQLGAFADTAQHFPRLVDSMATKNFRGMGTVMGGGWRERAAAAGKTGPSFAAKSGPWREGAANVNYGRSRNWTRMATQDYFHGTGAINQTKAVGKSQFKYSPFYGAGAINAVGRGMAGVEGSKLGMLSKTGVAKKMRASGMLSSVGDDAGELVSRGTLSRFTAAGRLGMMSDAGFARRMPNSMAGGISTSRHAGKFGKMASFIGDSGFSNADDIMAQGRTATRQALATGGAGTLSGYAGGFSSGARGPLTSTVRAGLEGRVAAGGKGAKGAASALKGAERAARWGGSIGAADDVGRMTTRSTMKATGRQIAGVAGKGTAAAAGKKVAAKGAMKGLALIGGSLLTGPAAPIVATIGTALLVKDLAKLAVTGVGHAAKLGADAVKSFQGNINTGIMDGGFTDTEASMTSRARGVQAIQNSRLNSRSILGNEAGAMHAHFS